MNASELLLISNQNKIEIKDVLEVCESQAKDGHVEAVFFKHFSVELISELGIAGFKVSQSKGPIGEKIFIVCWL